MENIQDVIATLGGMALTGAVVSVIVQYTKNWLASRGHKVLWVILLSVILGTGAYFSHLIPTGWIQVVFGVWASANSAYLVVYKYLLEK